MDVERTRSEVQRWDENDSAADNLLTFAALGGVILAARAIGEAVEHLGGSERHRIGAAWDSTEGRQLRRGGD